MQFLRPLTLLSALTLMAYLPQPSAADTRNQTAPAPRAPTPTNWARGEFIFEKAAFESCHASTLAESKGQLVAAWFGGKAEADPSVGIWLSRHEAGTWTAPVEVATGVDGDKRYPCWNPVLFQPKTGPLMLFYKVGPSPSRWWGMLMTSDDGGQTWGTPRRLPNGILGPIKNKPIQLGNAILCPSSTEDHGWQVHFERSDDGGKTWTSSGAVNDGQQIGAIQPSLLVHPDGSLQAIGRTRQGKLFTITSPDGGQTWGRMTLTNLPNPNSGTDAVTLRDGRFLLVYNHTPRSRSPLNVAISNDGETWTPIRTLEDGDGEYSYPAVIQTEDGLVHITYTWQRTHIKHVVLDPNTLRPPIAAPRTAGMAVLQTASYKHFVDDFNAAVSEDVVNIVPNALSWEWMTRNVPFFDGPDAEFLRTYYYRWWVYRRHLKATDDGYTFSEFILPVNWATKQNAISATACHHIMEGRWLRDPTYITSYLNFWYHGENGGPRHALQSYSNWLEFVAYQNYLVTGDQAQLTGLLPAMIEDYTRWETDKLTPSGLFWQYDVRDGMEESITGSRTHKNLRPTINAYMYGNARAIATIAQLADKPAIAQAYATKATRLRALVTAQLWDQDAQFFKVRKDDGTLSDAREQLGFVPWYFGLPAPRHAVAWRQFSDPKGFAAPYGLTSAEQRHPQFAILYSGHDCQWNGPVWPFATSQTLTAAANLLNGLPQDALTKTDYFRALNTYARSQRRSLPAGRTIAWIDEDQDPFTGTWIAREIKQHNGDPDPERGAQYLHSTFADLVISGLVGLRPRPDSTLEINPLLPSNTWDWFCLDAVPYHGHTLTIVWDKTGNHYHKGRGLSVWADGRRLATRRDLGRLTASLPTRGS